MSINEMIRICFDKGLDGRQTDTCVKSIAVNLLKPDMPVIPVAMANPTDLLHMMKAADDTHIYIAGNTLHLNAVYAISDNFPAPRIYFMKTQDLMQVGAIGAFMKKHGVTLPPMNDERFSKLIDDRHYSKRYQQWHENWTANNKFFNELLDGRIENTAVEQGIWLSSNCRCMVCGGMTDLMSTTTIFGEKGLMIGLQLCSQHGVEASDHTTLLNYVAEKMGVPAPFFADAKIVRHGQQSIDLTCEAVRSELECTIEKVEGRTVHAVRKSGFRVIIRQDALNDYAYNIQDPNKKPISRIDSADHHKVAYGPDHVHRDLRKSKKNIVEPSFTYGFAVADLKAIKRLLDDAEARWISSTSD